MGCARRRAPPSPSNRAASVHIPTAPTSKIFTGLALALYWYLFSFCLVLDYWSGKDCYCDVDLISLDGVFVALLGLILGSPFSLPPQPSRIHSPSSSSW